MPEVIDQAQPQTGQASGDPIADRKDLQNALFELAIKFYDYDKVPRRSEVIDTRQQRFYWRRIQYIWWNDAKNQFFAAPGAGTSYTSGSTSVDMPRYTDVYPIYPAFGRSIIAAFTQNPPGVRFQAEDPKDGNDLAAKSHAEKYRHYFDRVNDNKKVQQDIARYYWTDTRAVTVTEFDPELGHTATKAYGTLESKVPSNARNIKECPYVFIAFEREEVDAKAAFPEMASKIKVGNTKLGSEYERLARIGALQGSKTMMTGNDQHLVTQHVCWFRPSAFYAYSETKIKNPATGVSPDRTIKDDLLQFFPDGVKVTFMGDVYCMSEPKSIDDHIDISHPLPGDGMNRPSMGSFIVDIQDTVNDAFNLWKETYDYTIPVTWVGCQAVDLQAVREQMSEPGNHISFQKPPGEPMEDQFFREPPSTVSADFIKFIEELTGPLPQFITGALPALFGGTDSDNTTRGGIAMMREQAMGQMGLPWGSLQRHFAGIYQKAAKEEAKHREGDDPINVEIPADRGQAKVDQLDFQMMGNGKVLCFPDVDSSFPETYSAKRSNFMQFIQLAGPAAMEFLNTPNNLDVMKDMVGLEEFETPGNEACEKQRREISKMLQESMVPNEQAMEQAGMQAGMQIAAGQQPAPPDPSQMMESSVPIDVEMDFHQFEFAEVQRWLSSAEGQEAKESNPEGFANVRQHGLEHKAVMDQQAMQQAMQQMAAAAQKQAPPAQGAQQ